MPEKTFGVHRESGAMQSPKGPARAFVVFDLDGTLVDTSQDLTNALNHALRGAGLAGVTRRQVITLVGEGSRKLVDRAVRSVGGDPALADPVAKDFLDRYRDHVLDETTPYLGVEDVLTSMARNRDLCLYSNKPGRHVQAILEGLGWSRLFRHVFGGDWGGPRKPAPDGLMELCSRLGRPCAQGIMVGDGLTDVQAGRAAGMGTVAVTYGYRSGEDLTGELPGALCDAPSALPPLVAVVAQGRGLL